MAQPTFFEQHPPSTLAGIAALTKAHLVDLARADQQIWGPGIARRGGADAPGLLRQPEICGPTRYDQGWGLPRQSALRGQRAVACRGAEGRAAVSGICAAAREWHREALRPQSWLGCEGISTSAIIDPTARLEDGVIVEPLVVIGPNVEIGSGTIVGAGAVIGANVKIGRDCNVGPRTAIQYALIGNNVLIHPGCSIGQDGYGFLFFGPEGHLKVPQTGRVLIENDVEIGAGTTIDRGSLRDTVIGEGTKIDNQVQIGHNVRSAGIACWRPRSVSRAV